ncbi:MAG: PAS domain S-box protein, partial [Calditrichaeota bacterium]|nr:PAS domain S-box protein [Calditrichota bacterium]
MVIGLSEAELRTKLRSLEKAYRELQDSEQKYRLLFEDSAEGMISWDNERTIIAVNKIGAEILGYELPDSLIGLIVTDFFIDEAEAQPLLMIELG